MRARNIKPGFFKNEDLAELSMETRMLFIGLWLLADREGRLEDRPKRIKAELFAFENIDVDSMLNDLQSSSFLIRYVADGKKFIQVENFVKHQDPHYKEKKSEIPPVSGREDFIKATGVTRSTKQRILERDDYKCQECGATDGLCIDHIIPASRGGDSSDDNLQVLCISCNTKKGNRLAGEDKGCKKSKHDSGSVLVRSNVDSTLSQRNRSLPSDSLNPDSLNPDSLNPDSLNPDSLNPDIRIPDSSANAQDAHTRVDQILTTPKSKLPPGQASPEYSMEFELLWEQYPRKEAKESAWIAFKGAKAAHAYPGNPIVLPLVVQWRESPRWQEDDGKYIPMLANWISGKRWEDELTAAQLRPKKKPQSKAQVLQDQNVAAMQEWLESKGVAQ